MLGKKVMKIEVLSYTNRWKFAYYKIVTLDMGGFL